MGALARATKIELEELSSDPEWWPGVLGLVSDMGIAGLPEIIETHAWSFGAFRRWVAGSEEREAQWEEALRHYAEKCVLESLTISDEQALAYSKQGVAFDPDVPRDTLRVKTRQWAAEKLDRDRWGARVKVDGGGRALVDAALVGFAGELLARFYVPMERVVEAVEVNAVESEQDEI